MPVDFDGYVETEARVSSTCLIRVARNPYSVPCALHGHCQVHLYPERVIVAVANDETVVDHTQARWTATRWPTDWRHYVPLIEHIALGAAVRRAVRGPAGAAAEAAARTRCARR